MKNISKKQRKKLKIFETYSKNFDLTFPGNPNVYVCPICKRGTSHAAVLNGDLTEEHIIPNKFGGRISTLTCKDCNNQKEKNLEAHLSDFIHGMDVGSGLTRKTIRGQASINSDKPVTAEIGLDKTGETPTVTLAFDEARSNPEHVKELHLKQEIAPGTIQLSFPRYKNEAKSYAAILKIGYLLIFRHFGYQFIFTPIIDKVRQQIHSPQSHSEINFSIIKPNTPHNLEVGNIYASKLDNRIPCFLAYFKVQQDGGLVYPFGVIFPFPSDNHIGFYDFLKHEGEKKTLNLSNMRKLEYEPEKLIDPKYIKWIQTEII